MRSNKMARDAFVVFLAGLILLLLTAETRAQSIVFQDGVESGNLCRWTNAVPESCPLGDSDVYPARLNEVLVNPGMGFANFHFGWWCNLPPITFSAQECADRVILHWPDNYPAAGTAYFRWNWKDIEPVRGQIDFDMIDMAIQSANLLGETFSFRIMTILEGTTGVPQWLLDPPYNVPGEWHSGTFWPDYRYATFRAEHERFIAALGARYNDHPAVDHVDIGSVGCWGEWNTACLSGIAGIFEVFDPQTDAEYEAILDAYTDLIDHHVDAFPDTPVVMPGLGSGWELDTMLHATGRGAGWRVDCWGDWGFWGSWTHMEDAYPTMLANATVADPEFANLWQHAPIQLEICGTMPQWEGFGWTTDAPDGEVYKTFQWALQQHASVLNAKFTSIPEAYVPAIDTMLKTNGYRLVIDWFNHESEIGAGETMLLISDWSNLGVAPVYRPRTLTYRLKSATDEVTFSSVTDIRQWLPGEHRVSDTIAIPPSLPPGLYDFEVALLDRPGTDPATLALPPLFLGIDGRQSDGWYLISEIMVH
jgi:hypothetical protein